MLERRQQRRPKELGREAPMVITPRALARSIAHIVHVVKRKRTAR
jgi:hypothetical protein